MIELPTRPAPAGHVESEQRAERPLRFLFVMHYPGYLRYFDSVVRMLAAPGTHRCGAASRAPAG